MWGFIQVSADKERRCIQCHVVLGGETKVFSLASCGIVICFLIGKNRVGVLAVNFSAKSWR